MSDDILRFYRGECGNSSGDTLEDILTWDDDQLEADHDYIQWLFPSNEPSMLNSNAPVFSREDEAAFKSFRELRWKQYQCFRRMMEFYGYRVLDHGDNNYVELEPIEPTPGNPHPQHALEGFNHNMLRITRILKSTRLTGNDRCSRALWDALQVLRPQISDNTWGHWKRAAEGDLWIDLERKRIPGDLGTVTATYGMGNIKMEEEFTPKPNNLTSQDVIKTGTDVGKDVMKQTAVWVLAGALTDAVRKVIGSFGKKS